MKAKKHQEFLTSQHFNISVHEHVYELAFIMMPIYVQVYFFEMLSTFYMQEEFKLIFPIKCNELHWSLWLSSLGVVGVSPEYDGAKADLKAAERGLEEYLDRQRQRLGCRVSTALFYFLYESRKYQNTEYTYIYLDRQLDRGWAKGIYVYIIVFIQRAFIGSAAFQSICFS